MNTFKQCAKRKRAFTLAETIMTLAIAGLVITAAIPVMTTKNLSDNGKLLAYCKSHTDDARCKNINADSLFSRCGTANASLCTANTTYFVAGNKVSPIQYDALPSSAYFPFTYNLTAPISLYDYFLSDRNLIRIGNYYLHEQDSNLFFTSDVDGGKPVFPSGTKNAIIGSVGTGNVSNFNGNTIVGNGNNISTCNANSNNNIIYGTKNTLCNSNSVANSIVIGESNTVTHSNSLVIGTNNTTNFDNSLLIGQNINDNANHFSLNGLIVADSANSVTFKNSDGSTPNMTINGSFSNGKFTNSSDIRLKNIKGTYNKGLKEILQIEPVEFYYNNDKTKSRVIGVIAQDVQKVFPEAVVKMPSGYLGVDTDPIFFAMVNALKEVNDKALYEQKRSEELKKELAELENELSQSNNSDNNIFVKIWNFIKNLLGGIFNVE